MFEVMIQFDEEDILVWIDPDAAAVGFLGVEGIIIDLKTQSINVFLGNQAPIRRESGDEDVFNEKVG